MATAVKELMQTQLGVESTRGTAVAQTTRWIGEAEVTPQEIVVEPQAQNGVLLMEGHTSDVITLRHADVRLAADLTFEQILHVLMMSMEGGVTPTGAGADKTWLFNPTYLADPALNAFTLGLRYSDGTNNFDDRIAYLMARSFRLTGNIGEIAKIEADCFGRPVEDGTAITGAIAVPSVNFVPVALGKVYLDDTAGGIGGTQLSESIISFAFDFETMAQPKFYVDGRADKSFTTHGLKRANWALQLEAELNSAIDTERAKAQDRSIRYIRIEFVGAALGGSNYKITLDLPMRHRMGQYSPSGDRDGNQTVTLDLIAAYDSATPLGAKITVVNALTALP